MIAIAVTLVGASLATGVIDEIVRKNQPAVQACYDEGLDRNPTLAGKIVVLFTVENDGTVSDAVAKKGTTLKDETVVTCVVDSFRTLVFPSRADACDASKQDCWVKVTYPLTFSP